MHPGARTQPIPSIPAQETLEIRRSVHRRSRGGLARAFLAAWLVAGMGCGPGGSAQGPVGGPPPVSVEVVEVEVGTVEDIVDLVGQLESEESVLVRSEVAGLIESVEFREGQEVEKGRVLFRLRDDEQRARLHEAEAQLGLQQDVHRRTKELAARNVAATAQLDRASAELDAARARVELARVALDRTEVRAPFDGIVGVRQVSPGDRVTTSTGMVQIDAIARLQLVFTVPEIGVPLARLGAIVTIAVAPYPGESFAGEVFFVAPTLDPATRRLLLKAWVPNPDRRLRPGLFANIRVELGRREGALLVPEDAVVYDRNATIVWRVNGDNITERVPVELGMRSAGRVEVRRGLVRGDRVVSAGTHKVADGTKVSPKQRASAERDSHNAAGEPVFGGGG